MNMRFADAILQALYLLPGADLSKADINATATKARSVPRPANSRSRPRCAVNERPLTPAATQLRNLRTWGVFVLRARAAKNVDYRCGFTADLGCSAESVLDRLRPPARTAPYGPSSDTKDAAAQLDKSDIGCTYAVSASVET